MSLIIFGHEMTLPNGVLLPMIGLTTGLGTNSDLEDQLIALVGGSINYALSSQVSYQETWSCIGLWH